MSQVKESSAGGEGQQSTIVPNPATPGSNPSVPKIFSEEKNVNVAEVNQLGGRGESGQSLENVDRTHLVLVASVAS